MYIPPKDRIVIATAGAVDSGKSTLVGRLLSRWNKTYQGSTSYQNITDGLSTEQKQGITISVGNRYCNLGDTRIHFRDDPGHLEYIGQTVSGLWKSDIVLVVVDCTNPDYNRIRLLLGLTQWLKINRTIFILNKIDAISPVGSITDEITNFLLELEVPVHRILRVSCVDGLGLFNHSMGTTPCLESLIMEDIAYLRQSKNNSDDNFTSHENKGQILKWGGGGENIELVFGHLAPFNYLSWSDIEITSEESLENNIKMLSFIIRKKQNEFSSLWGICIEGSRAKPVGLIRMSALASNQL